MGYAVLDRNEIPVHTWNYTNEEVNENKNIPIIYRPIKMEYMVQYFVQNLDGNTYTKLLDESYVGYTGSKIKQNFEDDQDIVLNGNGYESAGFVMLPYDKDTVIAPDGSTLVKIYFDRQYFLVNFVQDGGTGMEPIYAPYGTSISDRAENPYVSTRTSYEFEGWYTNPDSGSPSRKRVYFHEASEGDSTGSDVERYLTIPARNITVYAQWNPVGTIKYSVIFWYENADDNNYTAVQTMELSAALDTILVPDSRMAENPNMDPVKAEASAPEEENGQQVIYGLKNLYFDMRDAYHFVYDKDMTEQSGITVNDKTYGGAVRVENDGSTKLNIYFKCYSAPNLTKNPFDFVKLFGNQHHV